VTDALTVSARRLTGSRASRLRATHSYGVVLGLIVGVFLFATIAPDEAWAGSTLLLAQGATLVTALWTSGLRRVSTHAGLVIGAVAVALAAFYLATGGDVAAGVVAVTTAAFVVLTIGTIAFGVTDQAAVNAQSVQGAICVYLLLGLFFVFLYGAVAYLGDGPFFAQGEDGTRADRVYFSYVTLATLGYGDFTPAGAVGRSLAVVEALLGQLYLVTVVALVVSRIGRARSASSRRDDGRAGPEE
jgi:hypothetical protein